MDTPTMTTPTIPAAATTRASLPPRPATTASVTFGSADNSLSHLPIPRISSVGNNLSGYGGASVSASARTSFTRVDEPVVDADPIEDAAPVQQPEDDVPHTPTVVLTFLLVSGRRRTMNFDPTHTVGRVKELVWNAWPGDWQDERPPAPSFLRILHRGRVLQDDDVLKDIPFPIDAPATIVHMSIRPGALEDDVSKKGDDDISCSCCCIIC